MGGNYTYTVARIRALEARMLTSQQMARMIEAPDIDQAFLVLHEACYGEHISTTIHPFDFKVIILEELRKTHRFLKTAAADDEALQILWRKYDYNFAKILVRARKMMVKEEDGRNLFLEFGTIKNETAAAYILRGEGSIPKWFGEAVSRAILAFEESGNPADADELLDSVYISDLASSGNPLLERLAAIWSEMKFPFDLEGDIKTVEILRSTKRKAFGIEPILAFWMAKEMEAKKTCQILICKKHHISLERLRESGVAVYA